MRLVWTKSSLPLSVFIRFLLCTDCSHFAMVFDSPDGGLMFESNLLGTHPKFYKTALKHLTVVHEIDLPLSAADENSVWDNVVDNLDDRSYDWRAFAYFTLRALLYKFFSVPLPATNPWRGGGTLLCTEIFRAAQKFTVLKDKSIDLSMTAPHVLYTMLSGATS